MKKFIYLAFLVLGISTYAQTTNAVKLKVTGATKKNDATRLVVQDSITKEYHWILKANFSGGGSAGTLQDVTDAGNTTTNPIVVQNIRISNEGNNPTIEGAILIGGGAGDDLVGTGSQSLLAIGTNSGQLSAGGNYQTYIGMISGTESDGESQTFVGYNSGNAQIGSQVVSIGSFSGIESNGNNCTFIGHGSGNGNLTDNVTALGTNAAVGNAFGKTIHLDAGNSTDSHTEATADNQLIINTNDNNIRFDTDVPADLDLQFPLSNGRLALLSDITGTNATGDGISITDGVIDVGDLVADTATVGTLQSSGDIESTGADIKAPSGTVSGAFLTAANDITAGGNVQAFTITTDDNVTVGNSVIVAGDISMTNQTASRIAIFDASKNIISASTATYPSLSELAFLKGVTSGVQAQINAKGSGTLTAVSVATANGFSGSSSGGATPAITITATPTGILKSNGTAISAATSGTDYAPATSGTSILKGNGSGGFSNAVSGTDYGDATLEGTQTFTGAKTFTATLSTGLINASRNDINAKYFGVGSQGAPFLSGYSSCFQAFGNATIAASGTKSFFSSEASVTSSTTAAAFTSYNAAKTINLTGSATGITRDFWAHSTLTSAPDHRALDIETGKIKFSATNTTAGTTGNQTINKISGTVNMAAAGTTITVTNNLVTASSLVFATIRTNDATADIKNVVPTAGSFTITLNAAATAETSIGFFVIN